MRFHSALAVVASITLPAAPAVAGWSHSSDVNLPIGLSLPNLQRLRAGTMRATRRLTLVRSRAGSDGRW